MRRKKTPAKKKTLTNNTMERDEALHPFLFARKEKMPKTGIRSAIEDVLIQSLKRFLYS